MRDLPAISTGWDFLDPVLGGGQKPGHLYGILSETGGGRTTLATMIASKGAAREFELARTGGQSKPGLWIFVSPSQNGRQIRYQAIAQLAALPRLFTESDLLRRGNEPEGIESFAKAEAAIQNHFLVLDDVREVTGGDFTLVGRLSQALVARSGTQFRIAGIVLDNVSELCTVGVHDFRTCARLLNQFLHACKTYVASQWDCPVWVTHTIAARLWKTDWKRNLSHSDASSCRKFGDNLDACVILGPMETVPPNRFLLHAAKGGPRNITPLPMVFATGGASIRPVAKDEFPERVRKIHKSEAITKEARKLLRALLDAHRSKNTFCPCATTTSAPTIDSMAVPLVSSIRTYASNDVNGEGGQVQEVVTSQSWHAIAEGQP